MSTATSPVPADLHELIRERWSPRQFSSRPVEPEKLRNLFEAARWAASCFNEQPWRFIVATQAEPEAFARVLGVLMEKNQQWAKTAWALGFSAGKKAFTQSGAPNRFCLHDTGAATATLAVEGTAMGLRTHFMGGFDTQRARTEFHVPDDFEIGAAFAIGYIDEEATVPGARTRKTLDEIVFGGDWGAHVPFPTSDGKK
jgi:nitroreductase